MTEALILESHDICEVYQRFMDIVLQTGDYAVAREACKTLTDQNRAYWIKVWHDTKTPSNPNHQPE